MVMVILPYTWYCRLSLFLFPFYFSFCVLPSEIVVFSVSLSQLCFFTFKIVVASYSAMKNGAGEFHRKNKN